MIARNLRHFRLMLAVAEQASLSRAAEQCFVTQPAVSQAIAKLEREAGGAIFERHSNGFFLSPRGDILAARVARAFGVLDPALAEISPKLWRTISYAQLLALIAVHEAENFSLAARRMGVAQPTVHRAIAQIEQQAGRALFTRSVQGIVANRACEALSQAARLAMYELDQAEADLAEFDGREVGQIVIGAMPLSRSVILPKALAAFRMLRPRLPVRIVDGPYDQMVVGLRRGEIDFLIGALRDPAPIGDIDQQALFDDTLILLAGKGHPMAGRDNLTLEALATFPWIVPPAGTPTRRQFDALFAAANLPLPGSVLESGSILLMREMLGISPHLGCISRIQAMAEIDKDLLVALNFATDLPGRPIGLTQRLNWQPTKSQRLLLDLLRQVVPNPPN